jgi:hypothetical protein
MAAQGEKTVYETVPLLGKFCLSYRGLAATAGVGKSVELDAAGGLRNDQ